jgi:hypothetical protein
MYFSMHARRNIQSTRWLEFQKTLAIDLESFLYRGSQLSNRNPIGSYCLFLKLLAS